MGRTGKCSLCLSYGNLTFEHIPPKRVFNNCSAVAHTLFGLEIGSKYNKKPALLKNHGGLGRYSLCDNCNRRTAFCYGDAFAEWTAQCLRYADKVFEESEILLPFQIKPLNVLKQIGTMVLAVSGSSESATSFDRLRAFVLSQNSMDYPMNIVVAAYMNPIDPGRRGVSELTQNRLSASCAVLDTRIGSNIFVVGEVAFPPMGYVGYIRADGKRISSDFSTLYDLRGFSNYRYGQSSEIFMSMPLRRPFGPVRGYYPNIRSGKRVPYIDDNHVVLTTKNAHPKG
jgi:hypothetical protein